MSEYPVSCKKCGMYLGYIHATRWSENYLCKKCYLEKYPKADTEAMSRIFIEE